MSKIEWKDEYNLGIEEVDLEHKIFVKIIIKIDNAITKDDNNPKIQRLIVELLKYASFHFQSEENSMIDIGYPDILEHKKQHEKLISRLQLTLLKIEIGQQDMTELPSFLIDWFKNHTIQEDKKLVTYL